MVGGQGRGAELGLEDSPEGEDQVPEGLVLPAPSGWVSVGLSQEGRPLWVRPMGRGQTAAGMEPLNPEQPTLMALPCVPTIHRQWHPSAQRIQVHCGEAQHLEKPLCTPESSQDPRCS